MPVIYLTASPVLRASRAGANPWNATGLEWQTASPPPVHNFDEIPIVYFGPYEYSIVDGLGELAEKGGLGETLPATVEAAGVTTNAHQGVTGGR